MSIDNTELDEIMEKLENLDDEVLAVEKLREFNNATKKLGELLMNLNKDLSHGEWKTACDEAKKEVDRVVAEIKAL
ncbi:hypothetical protein BIY24_11270 [Halobacteriovorax marinus]|uniref:Uncharacterized protein n=1 Tax=Halobacteriovorax marinus (strain ATCC BAA-682 / DSM 15412 / SJ) TaxID=862908 RepID=E1X4X7_HALMS|nr:hypothetical protein [Halobacteriovorax marinus]ATH08508.1 hypothetical protein BIY24_11270 [Halobacteriovorax marinus]CBW27203.1 hypothetical protein BMS_2407 [Halobacteriovorax marinus SJ]